MNREGRNRTRTNKKTRKEQKGEKIECKRESRKEQEEKKMAVTATGLEPTTTKFINEQSTIQPNWQND